MPCEPMTTPFYITQLLYLTIHRIMSIYMVNITHGIETVTRYVTVQHRNAKYPLHGEVDCKTENVDCNSLNETMKEWECECSFVGWEFSCNSWIWLGALIRLCVGLVIRDVLMSDFHLYEWKISEAHLIHVWTGNNLVCSRNFY